MSANVADTTIVCFFAGQNLKEPKLQPTFPNVPFAIVACSYNDSPDRTPFCLTDFIQIRLCKSLL